MTNTMTLGRKALLILLMAFGAIAATLTPLANAQHASAGHLNDTVVCFYQHENYGGWAWCREEVYGEVHNFVDYGINDQASALTASVRGWAWLINTGQAAPYEHAYCHLGYGGAVFGPLNGPGDWAISSLVPYGWNDRMSSLCF